LIVLIGASGFIGRHLLSGVLRGPAPIRCLARHASALTGESDVEVVEGDMRDEASVERCLEPGATVINLAYDRAAPAADNVAAARVLARACKRKRVARLLHLSTATVVGKNAAGLIDETSRCEPATAYESAKFAIEEALRAERGAHELVIVRPTAVFGTGGRNVVKLAREMAGGTAIPRYLRACLQGRRAMNLVSVETVCAAIVHLASRPGSHAHGVFIVSEDDAPQNNYRDVEDVLMKAFGRAPYGLPPVPLPVFVARSVRRLAGRSSGDPQRRFSSAKLLRTGFVKPLDFDEALRRYASHLARQFHTRGEVLG
jgi:nucleoside-diphosphate-sugar epimerase